jgi:hypothetical protein
MIRELRLRRESELRASKVSSPDGYAMKCVDLGVKDKLIGGRECGGAMSCASQPSFSGRSSMFRPTLTRRWNTSDMYWKRCPKKIIESRSSAKNCENSQLSMESGEV